MRLLERNIGGAVVAAVTFASGLIYSTTGASFAATDFLAIDALSIDILFRGHALKDNSVKTAIFAVLPASSSSSPIEDFSLCRMLGHNVPGNRQYSKKHGRENDFVPELKFNNSQVMKYLGYFHDEGVPLVERWHEYQRIFFAERKSKEDVARLVILKKNLQSECGVNCFRDAQNLLFMYSPYEKNWIAKSTSGKFPGYENLSVIPVIPNDIHFVPTKTKTE